MIKKLYILIFLFVFSISFSTTLNAQPTIAVIDVVTLLKESKAAKSMKDQLNEVAKKYTEQEKKKADDIRKKEEELLRQKKTLTPEAFSDRKNAFEKIVIEFNKDRDAKRKALSKAEINSIQKIEEVVEQVVQEIQKNDNITIVVRKSAVILSDPSIDITSQVVEKLNKQISTIDVKVTP
tara:strand:+ start:933 stop:1472 length:540 start_codon:yes stop_codon:yes gene_type:complete